MGGFAVCEISTDTKASPRLVAIEKAQEELRLEYDVREERRRELEFLEKGGNPLDFKVGTVSSLSLQSTSLTDQPTEQHAISEAKGSSAQAASPYGDSVESSGKPGSSVGREPHTGDNLLLLDGDNSNIGECKNIKSGSKSSVFTQSDHSLPADGQRIRKEIDGSITYRAGTKSQAYARRNRSKHRSPAVPPTVLPDTKDAKVAVSERRVEEHVLKRVPDTRPSAASSDIATNTVDIDERTLVTSITEKICHGSDTNGKDVTVSQSEDAHVSPVINKEIEVGSRISDQSVHNPAISHHRTGGDMSEPKNLPFEAPPVLCQEDVSAGDCGYTEKLDNAQISVSTSPLEVHDVQLHDRNDAGANAETTVAPGANKVEAGSSTSSPNNVDSDATDNTILRCKVDADACQQIINKSLEDSSPLKSDIGKQLSLQMDAVNQPINHAQQETQNETNGSIANAGSVQNGSDVVKNEVEVIDNSEQSRVGLLVSVDTSKDNTLKANDTKLTSVDEQPALREKCEDTQAAVRDICANTQNEVIPVSNIARENEAETLNPSISLSKMAIREREECILTKARIIEATRKIAGELPAGNISLAKSRKSHWDFVLEEMAWMANDFMQERLWKIKAAAHVSRLIASGAREKIGQLAIEQKRKNLAKTLSNAIMRFWHSVEATCGESPVIMHKDDSLKQDFASETEKLKDKNCMEAEKVKDVERRLSVHVYALRFLKYSGHTVNWHVLAEAPQTPDGLCDMGISEVSDDLSEECLFYCVPPNAMQIYRDLVESQFLYHKNTANIAQKEECETSMCDSVADGPRERVYDEDEGETCAYSTPRAYEGGFLLKSGHIKKNQMQQKHNGARLQEVCADMSYEQSFESKPVGHQLLPNGKRPSSFLVTIPTKRVRTAARQRIVGSSYSGAAGCQPLTSKTDVSSGDTNSYQDDQSSLYGGPFSRKNMEVESTLDYKKQMQCDGSEMAYKSKKKKKPKHLGYKNSLNLPDSSAMMVPGKGMIFDQRRQLDALAQYDQKEFLKKRIETQFFDSNGNSVLYGHHPSKKLKVSKLEPDACHDARATAFISGPAVSPAASQMSNMAMHSKAIKISTSSKSGKKSKSLKVAATNSTSGAPWSNFEEQALVVLVHDMGPNWELVSDAINSTLRFKCIYRKPMECKERHKLLMDKSGGDGWDSADDSGSSQPYPSTLPGIPKGSAIQLFQRLQGPVEEDTLRSHFEKIISIGRHLSRRQIASQEIMPVHNSHSVVISQACPNQQVTGVLTPLDLCEATTPNPEILSHGYPAHSNGVVIPNHHGQVSPNPPPNYGARVLNSPGMVVGSNLPASSVPLATPVRDAQRYGYPRTSSPQGMQYPQVYNSRTLQQSGVSALGIVPSGVDRNIRMLRAGHNVPMASGGASAQRPVSQRTVSPGMPNIPANLLPTGAQGLPSGLNVHPASVPGNGNTMLRPRDPLQMMRPGQNLEEQRHMIMQEMQIQVSQGNNQNVHFHGVNGAYPAASSAASPGQSFAVQPSQQPHHMQQQPHQMQQQSPVFGTPHPSHIQGPSISNPQQQYLRVTKEKQMQQRMLSQQHQLSANASVPAAQNGSPIQQQTHTSIAPVSSSQQQLKPPHVGESEVPGITNQHGNAMQNKQKQRQQTQQQTRQNQQQRQQSQQPTKGMKNLSRSNLMMQQNHLGDANQASGYIAASQTQVLEKNVVQQGQAFFAGNTSLLSPLPPPGIQSKVFSSLPPPTQAPAIILHPDINKQGTVQAPQNQALLTAQQPPVASLPSSAQAQQHHGHIIPPHSNVQRVMVPQNRLVNADSRIESLTDSGQHNQIIPTTSFPQSTESINPGVSSLTQLASSPQEGIAGNDALLVPSSQGLIQRQVAIHHSQGIANQWPQQQPRLQMHSQQQQQQQQVHNQQRPLVQGNVYTHLSDPGPG